MKKRLLIIIFSICLIFMLIPAAHAEQMKMEDPVNWDHYTVTDLATGERHTFYCDIPDDGAAVLVFFSPGCMQSQAFFRSLDQAAWVNNPYVEFAALDIIGFTAQDIYGMLEENALNVLEYLNVYADDSDLGFQYRWVTANSNRISMPLVIVLTNSDSGRTIRFAASPQMNAEDVYNVLCEVSTGFAAYEAKKESGEAESHAHSYGEWTCTVEPTCTQSGEEARICSCGAKYSRSVDPLGHQIVDGTLTTAPSETEEGVFTCSCARCGEALRVAIPALGTNGLMDSGDLSAVKPTREELKAGWDSIDTASEFFSEVPSTTAPYTLGQLSDELLQSGLSYLNYVRYSANLPLVQLSDALNENAQYGAVTLAALDTMTHYPWQPAGMDDAFYEQGAEAASSSNLSMSYGFHDENPLQFSVQSCMNDLGANNLPVVGHRRRLLNPTLLNVGFGFAEAYSGCEYTLTKVFDSSGDAIDYDFISWPASGVFSNTLFGNAVPWSITLNPDKYLTPDMDDVVITLTRKSDGKTWLFNSGTGEPVSSSAPYMTIDTGNYGVDNCIIFTPGSENIKEYEGTYTVTVGGIYYTDGTPATVHYEVDFFDASKCLVHSYSSAVTAPTCTQKGYTRYTCDVCSDSYVDHYVDASGHTEAIDTAIPATCTEAGRTEGKHCSVCSTVLIEQESIPVTEHSYGDWKVTVPATGASEGVELRSCVNCGQEQTRSIEKLTQPFVDVAPGKFYEAPVLWAVDNGITNGVDAAHFAPDATCNRGQVVTFLWRAAGSPEPTSTNNPFTDVVQDKFYYKAVLWAVENGITNGTSATAFSPSDDCTRGQVATFLWRTLGNPSASSSTNPFTDVQKGKFYYNAVLWAAENGITSGMTKTTFAPDDTCTRGQIVTFLYRALGSN